MTRLWNDPTGTDSKTIRIDGCDTDVDIAAAIRRLATMARFLEAHEVFAVNLPDYSIMISRLPLAFEIRIYDNETGKDECIYEPQIHDAAIYFNSIKNILTNYLNGG